MKKTTMKYRIPVQWMMIADMEVEANSFYEAMQKVKAAPLPDDGEYLHDSFEINMELIAEAPDLFGEIKP